MVALLEDNLRMPLAVKVSDSRFKLLPGYVLYGGLFECTPSHSSVIIVTMLIYPRIVSVTLR